jgi:flagellar motility protein MotE (MotC chaperone)
MSGKKSIIVLAVAAVVSFSGALGVTYVLKKRSAGAAHAGTPTTGPAVPVAPDRLALTPKESELEDLIKEVRQKGMECQRRELLLEEREKRVVMSEELLKKESQDLENLRIQLVAPLATLKDERARLDKSRVKVTQEEADNLKHSALIYEKMDPASGARIIENMCDGSQAEDAAKILHFMSERAAAKLLAEISDKGLASELCERMKRIRQES